MNLNKHLNLVDKHSVLSPSLGYWANYEDEDLIDLLVKERSREIGTILHKYAYLRILHKIKLKSSGKDDMVLYLLTNGIPRFVVDYIDIDMIFGNLKNYVNDGINYRMTPEQPLSYNDEFCFGTADALSFRKDLLRIHDLKTGIAPAKMRQLEIYAALFCLEYKIKPADIDIELAIYQNGEVLTSTATPEVILPYMDRIVSACKLFTSISNREG